MKDTGRGVETAAINMSMDVDEFLALVQYSVSDPLMATTLLDHVGIYPGRLLDDDEVAKGYSKLMASGVMEMDYTKGIPAFLPLHAGSTQMEQAAVLISSIMSEASSFVFIRVMLGHAVNSLTLLSNGTGWALLWMSGRQGPVGMSIGYSRYNMSDTIWSKISRICEESTPKKELTLAIMRVGADRSIKASTSLFGSKPEFHELVTKDPVLSSAHTGLTTFKGLYMYPNMNSFRDRVENITEVI